jgi:hypothetical protein
MPLPFYTWRTARAYPGDTIYFWSPTRQLGGAIASFTVTGPFTLVEPTYLGQDADQFVMGVKVADDASADTYSDAIAWHDSTAGDLAFDITVLDSPSVDSIVIPSGSDQSVIQDAIDDGKNLILLSPGDYPITTHFDLPTGTPGDPIVIDGQGWASLTRLPEAMSAHQEIFETTWPITLRRLTIRGTPVPDYAASVFYLGSVIYVEVSCVNCKFEDCTLGIGYTAAGGDDVTGTTGGVLLQDCEFVRAGTNEIQHGTVVNRCIFRGSAPGSPHAFFNSGSQKWLVLSCDWVRTPRGIVCQGGDVQNGVVIGCRFFDIVHTQFGSAEVILFENALNTEADMSNNAFVACHMFGCTSAGIFLVGGGMNNNLFRNMTVHNMSGSIGLSQDLEGTSIHDNKFEIIEVAANVSVAGHCFGNYFNQIVALYNPISCGGLNAILQFYGYNDPVHDAGQNIYQGRLPFSDTSTRGEEESPNQYHNLYLSYPNGLFQVFQFPNVSNSSDAVNPPP